MTKEKRGGEGIKPAVTKFKWQVFIKVPFSLRRKHQIKNDQIRRTGKQWLQTGRSSRCLARGAQRDSQHGAVTDPRRKKSASTQKSFTQGSGNQTASDLTSVLEDKGDAIRTLRGIGFHFEF